MQVGIVQFIEDLNRTERWRKDKFALFAWTGTSTSPALRHQHSWFPDLWTWTELYHRFSWVSSLWMASWDFSASIIVWVSSYNLSPLYLSIYHLSIYLSIYHLLFLWRTVTYTWGKQRKGVENRTSYFQRVDFPAAVFLEEIYSIALSTL